MCKQGNTLFHCTILCIETNKFWFKSICAGQNVFGFEKLSNFILLDINF